VVGFLPEQRVVVVQGRDRGGGGVELAVEDGVLLTSPHWRERDDLLAEAGRRLGIRLQETAIMDEKPAHASHCTCHMPAQSQPPFHNQ
jgi:hypothetical protein